MTASPKARPLTVAFHLGAEHASFEAAPDDSLASLKQRALTAMAIVIDPSIDYPLSFEGKTVEDETQTLAQILGDHARPHVNFLIKKRPKGG